MTGTEKEALEVLQPFLGDELAKAIVEFRRQECERLIDRLFAADAVVRLK